MTADDLSYYTPEYVAGRLEQAGKTLLALPGTGCFPAGLKVQWPEYANAIEEAYGYTPEHQRPAVPKAKAISEMDEAYRWITLVDDIRSRKILLLRALVDPVSDKPRFSWRRLKKQFGLHIDTLKRAHERGVGQIASKLNAGGKVK